MIVLLVVHHEAYYGRGVTFCNCSSTFTEASSVKERQSLLSAIEFIKKEKSHSFIRSGNLQSFEDTDRQLAYDSLKLRFPILNNFRSVHMYNEDTFMFISHPESSRAKYFWFCQNRGGMYRLVYSKSGSFPSKLEPSIGCHVKEELEGAWSHCGTFWWIKPPGW